MRYDAGSRWMIPMGVVMLVGGLGAGWVMWFVPPRWPFDGYPVQFVFMAFAMGFTGATAIVYGLMRLAGLEVQLRLTKEGFHDYRSGVAFTWAEVRDLRLEYLKTEESLPIPMLLGIVDRGQGEEELTVRLGGLNVRPEVIGRTACAYAAHPAAESFFRWRNGFGLEPGAPLEAFVAKFVGKGASLIEAQNQVYAAAGGQGARCARCQLTFDPTKTQCPECWEPLTPIALQADG